MTNLYTIGFTKKSAIQFFEALKQNNVRILIDVRLNNISQLAGYTKKDDLKYFLKSIANIEYIHFIELAPTDNMLKNYRDKKISWNEYETIFNKLLFERKPEKIINKEMLADACLLCSEGSATNCHRRLVAEYFKKVYQDIEIKHI